MKNSEIQKKYIQKIEKLKKHNELYFDKVFNCTYNQLQTHQNVIYEKCLNQES